jgi:hypothetical protein
MALCAASLAFASEAKAYRPFDGTDADVAGFGEFELELGPAHYLTTPAGKYLIAPATVLNLGFAPRFELVVDAKNHVALAPVAGESTVRLLDTDVFIKILLRKGALQDATGLSIATELGPLLPEIGGQNAFGAQANLITSYRWSALALHLNTSAAYSRARNFEGFASVIVEGPHEWVVRPVGELAVDAETNVSTSYSGLVGAIWEAHERLAIDAALRASHAERGESYEVRLGLTWLLPLWGGEEEPKTTASARARHRISLLRPPAL